MEKYTALNRQFINGVWKDGLEDVKIYNLNPFNEEVIHSLTSAGKGDVDLAFSAAKTAFSSWGVTNPLLRRNLFAKGCCYINGTKGRVHRLACY